MSNVADSAATIFSARVHEPTATAFRAAAAAAGHTNISDAVREAIAAYAGVDTEQEGTA